MTTIISGSSPSITFSDATTQTTAANVATSTTAGTVYAKQTSGGGTPYLTAFGYNAGVSTTGASNTAVGTSALFTNSTGTNGTSVGYQSLYLNTASNNTAVGYQAGYSNLAGTITALGALAGWKNSSGTQNVSIGNNAQYSTTTGANNVAIGYYSFNSNDSGSNCTAIGTEALTYNTASNNTAVGYQAGYTNTGTPSNVSGSVFVGYQAGYSQTTPSAPNVIIGYRAGYYNQTGERNVLIGWNAGYGVASNSFSGNVCIGVSAGNSLTTGSDNTFIGCRNSGAGAGNDITTGSKNTIIGQYGGNSNGLDIRTSSNRIVLSDGDGNPRAAYTDVGGNSAWCFSTQATPTRINASECVQVDSNALGYGIIVTGTSGTVAMRFYNQTPGAIAGAISFTGTTTTYGTSSDYRLKENIQPMQGALAKVALLKPVTYKWKADGLDGQGFIAHELQEVIPDSVYGEKDGIDDRGDPQYQSMDASFLVATLTAAIQELKAEFDAYKATHP